MANFDYVEAASTAKELVSYFGSGGSFTRVTGGAIDPFTGESTTENETVITGIVTPVVPFSTGEIDGTVILSGDGSCYFEGELIEVGDVTTIAGETYRVIGVTKIVSVDSVTVYQKLHVRS